MYREQVINDYFEWMCGLVEGQYEGVYSYRTLLKHLHSIEFTYRMRKDSDRAGDGINLRHRFALRYDGDYSFVTDCLDGPCSVFEMMLALAIRCEESIMADPLVGDRTRQWFWRMIISLGLGDALDARYDKEYVEDVIDRFLKRKYEPDGRGGLFIIKNCDYDLRHVEIWKQMMWYLDTMI